MILTHLLFVDNILLLCNGSREEAGLIREILHLFMRAIRMVINHQNSTIYLACVKEVVANHYKRIFPFESLDFDEGIKYLGFKLKPNSYKKIGCMWLIAKFEKAFEMLELSMAF
jgi:hypothetical protein